MSEIKPKITMPGDGHQGEVKGLTSQVAQATKDNVIVDKKPMVNDNAIDLNEFMQPATADVVKKLNDAIDWSKIKDDDIFHDAIVAIDLKLPSYLDVKPKDPSVMFRWVNRKFNGEGGNRYEQMRSMGFRNTEPDDCATKFDPNRINTQDGGILCGDLILMKIPKILLLGMYRANYNKSNKMFNSTNVNNEARNVAKQEFRTATSNEGVRGSAYAGKVGFFTPVEIPSMGGDL